LAVKIVTDSTCDLTPQIAQELGVTTEEYASLVAAGVTGTLDDLSPPP